MVETGPGFDRTRPLAPESSRNRGVFPSHEIVSARCSVDIGTGRLVDALEEDRDFEGKASSCRSARRAADVGITKTTWLALWRTTFLYPGADVAPHETPRKARPETAINLVLRDRQPPPNQNAIFEIVSLRRIRRVGALSDQDYLARLYISNYFGRRNFIQVCVRPLRCRQRFRYRSFRSQPNCRLNDSSGHFDESRTVACRQRFSCTRCFRIGEGRLYRGNIVASDITDDGDTGCY